MSRPQSHTRKIKRLSALRSSFGGALTKEKLALLRSIQDLPVHTSRDLKQLHEALCFIRAFPDTRAHYRVAHAMLLTFEKRVLQLSLAERDKLWDTGIAGTPVYYAFSYETASWLQRNSPGTVTIDWDEIEDTSRLDDVLEQVVLPVETDYFDSGIISSQEWLALVSGNTDTTEFDWLIARQRQLRNERVLTQMYNAAELPLTWNLGSIAYSKSRNILTQSLVSARHDGMRRTAGKIKTEIMRPLEALQKVSTRAGARLISIAIASLAVRHRETFHFNCANSREVYVANAGKGVSIAIFGLQPASRYPLECTMGYLILSNGVPVGYGGASALFRQVNTGVNIFDEYRGSEAAWLWVQVMRVYHHLFACIRFIANPFQFGSENDEALRSGAFWFYYRLGYRPVLEPVRKLAQRESIRIRRDKSYRCELPILRRLASCDMHLTLPGARAGDLFHERWIETSSLLATRELAAAGGATREESERRVVATVSRDLRLRSTKRWSKQEQAAYRQIAPIVAAAKPATWSGPAKESMRKLLRAKGSPSEAPYARLLSEHQTFLSALRSSCQAEEKSRTRTQAPTPKDADPSR